MSNEWLSESFWLWWDHHPRVGVPIHSDSGDEMGELASLDSSAFSARFGFCKICQAGSLATASSEDPHSPVWKLKDLLKGGMKVTYAL